jgi:hypothetical protein
VLSLLGECKLVLVDVYDTISAAGNVNLRALNHCAHTLTLFKHGQCNTVLHRRTTGTRVDECVSTVVWIVIITD